MEYERKHTSSGVSKTAAALGGTALALNLLGINPGGLLGGGVLPEVRGAGVAGGYLRELAEKDSIIARLAAEKYADAVAAPLAARICELETRTAVNAARDADFRCYVEREFVHQPKAYMHNSIVTTQPSCCCDTPAAPVV